MGSWRPRWFQLSAPSRSADGRWGAAASGAVLEYTSEARGERVLLVQDVRRERGLDAGQRVGFSVGLAAAGPLGRRRVYLAAASDMEAVVALACLRRILKPGRPLPTLWETMHFPHRALKKLE